MRSLLQARRQIEASTRCSCRVRSRLQLSSSRTSYVVCVRETDCIGCSYCGVDCSTARNRYPETSFWAQCWAVFLAHVVRYCNLQNEKAPQFTPLRHIHSLLVVSPAYHTAACFPLIHHSCARVVCASPCFLCSDLATPGKIVFVLELWAQASSSVWNGRQLSKESPRLDSAPCIRDRPRARDTPCRF